MVHHMDRLNANTKGKGWKFENFCIFKVPWWSPIKPLIKALKGGGFLAIPEKCFKKEIKEF